MSILTANLSATELCGLNQFIEDNQKIVWIQNRYPHSLSNLISGEYTSLSVLRIDLSDYELSLLNNALCDNAIYITESDYLEAYGQTIENLSTSGVEGVSQGVNTNYVNEYFVNKNKVGYLYDKNLHSFRLSVDGDDKVLSVGIKDVFDDDIIKRVTVTYNESLKCNVIRIYFDAEDKEYKDIKLSDLLRVYKAGNGIEISSDVSTILSISVKDNIISSCNQVSANYAKWNEISSINLSTENWNETYSCVNSKSHNWDEAYEKLSDLGNLSELSYDDDTLSSNGSKLSVNIPITAQKIKKHINISDNTTINYFYTKISTSSIDDIKIEYAVSALYELIGKLK